MRYNKKKYKYIYMLKNEKKIKPDFIKLDKTEIDIDTYSEILYSAEKIGVTTAELIEIAVGIYSGRDSLEVIMDSIKRRISSIKTSPEDDEIFKVINQSEIKIWEKIDDNTYGGVNP